MSNQSIPNLSASRPTSYKSRIMDLESHAGSMREFILALRAEMKSSIEDVRAGKISRAEFDAAREAIEAYNAENHEALKNSLERLNVFMVRVEARLSKVERRVTVVERDVDGLGRQVRLNAERTTELENASAEQREILKGLAPMVKRLEEQGGSISNFGSLVSAGFKEENRKALIQLRGLNAEMSDDEFAAWLLLETYKLSDTVADHSSRLVELEQNQAVHGVNIAKNTDGVTAVNARVDKHVTYINQLSSGGNFWAPLLFGVIIGLASIPFVTRALDNGWLELIMVVGVFGLAFGLASEFANSRRKRALLDDSPATKVEKTEVVVVEEEEGRKSIRSMLHDFFVVPEVENNSTQVVSREVTDRPNGSSAPAVEPHDDEPGYAAARH